MFDYFSTDANVLQSNKTQISVSIFFFFFEQKIIVSISHLESDPNKQKNNKISNLELQIPR